jgi:hypothetical protein
MMETWRSGAQETDRALHTLLRSTWFTEKAEAVAKRAAKTVHFMVNGRLWSEKVKCHHLANTAEKISLTCDCRAHCGTVLPRSHSERSGFSVDMVQNPGRFSTFDSCNHTVLCIIL